MKKIKKVFENLAVNLFGLSILMLGVWVVGLILSLPVNLNCNYDNHTKLCEFFQFIGSMKLLMICSVLNVISGIMYCIFREKSPTTTYSTQSYNDEHDDYDDLMYLHNCGDKSASSALGMSPIEDMFK